MTNEVIGQCACPLCKSEFEQEIRLAKTGKPYLTCEECGVQIFARQGRSAKLLRALVTAPAQQTAPKPHASHEPAAGEGVAPAATETPAKTRGIFAKILDAEVL
jgi:DNA-directed RNA polymerase subunit RPC12/RpoP